MSVHVAIIPHLRTVRLMHEGGLPPRVIARHLGCSTCGVKHQLLRLGIYKPHHPQGKYTAEQRAEIIRLRRVNRMTFLQIANFTKRPLSSVKRIFWDYATDQAPTAAA
jgi:hypothetical protein